MRWTVQVNTLRFEYILFNFVVIKAEVAALLTWRRRPRYRHLLGVRIRGRPEQGKRFTFPVFFNRSTISYTVKLGYPVISIISEVFIHFWPIVPLQLNILFQKLKWAS